jgi:hypothetical protein
VGQHSAFRAADEALRLPLREQFECIDVARPKHAEVTMVQGSQFRLAEPFHDAQHRSIDKANVRIGVPIAEGSNAGIVGVDEVDNEEGTSPDVVEHRQECTRTKSLASPVVKLYQDRGRHQDVLKSCLE